MVFFRSFFIFLGLLKNFDTLVKLLLAVAAYCSWEAVMIDLTNAYFQADLSERKEGLYLVPPEDIKDTEMIWKVRVNLYGLRDGVANLR